MPVATKQHNRIVDNGTKQSAQRVESAWDLLDNIRLLLYGESGTGKTTTWATFPGPILALICSGGSKPGELRSIDTPEYRKKISPVVLPNDPSWVEVYKRELDRAGEFETVVLDHASGFADLNLMGIMGMEQVMLSKYRIAGKGETWAAVSMQQYGQLSIQLKEAFRDLLNLPCNVVIVAQQRTFGGREDGVDPELIRPTVGAALTPSVAGWLNPACDYVVQAFKRPRTRELSVETEVAGVKVVSKQLAREKGVEYCLRCEPHDVYQTKFRVPGAGKVPDVIVLGDSVNGVDKKTTAYQKLVSVIESGRK